MKHYLTPEKELERWLHSNRRVRRGTKVHTSFAVPHKHISIMFDLDIKVLKRLITQEARNRE